MRAVVVLLLCSYTAGTAPVVTVPGVGTLRGSLAGDSTAAFLGVPYAAPPTGKLRWQPPHVHAPWVNTRDASSFGNRCLQPLGVGANASKADQSEDCLHLNIYKPVGASASDNLPVMLWIHGGAYVTGESNDYSGQAIVENSKGAAIVVVINYRLNVFGFLGSNEINISTAGGGAGNFGIQDQRAAMRWTRDHIGSFGGNGSNLMIFGESAGGNSVINHLAQPDSFPLYNKAVVESGAYDTGAKTFDEGEKQYADLLKKTKCTDLDCLLAVDAAKILEAGSATQAASWAPTVDMVSLTAAPTELITRGQYNNQVPIIIGSNRDEAAFFEILLRTPKQLTETEFDVLQSALDPGKLKALKKLYDPKVYEYPKDLGPYSQWWWENTRISTDTVPGLGPCAVRWLARSFVKGGSPAVYTYLFAHPAQVDIPNIPGTGPHSVVVPHASEIAFVFGGAPNRTNPGAESDLATAMSSYWYSFAMASDPNHATAVKWPLFGEKTDMVMRFDEPAGGGIRAQKSLRKAVCDYNEPK